MKATKSTVSWNANGVCLQVSATSRTFEMLISSVSENGKVPDYIQANLNGSGDLLMAQIKNGKHILYPKNFGKINTTEALSELIDRLATFFTEHSR